MKIVATQYNLQNEALEIYLSGCDFHCPGCHNPELWDYNIGTDWKEELPKIWEKIKSGEGLIKRIWILGGEPLHQNPEEFEEFIMSLQKGNELEVWLFTGVTSEEVHKLVSLDLFDYIKTGRYVEEERAPHTEYGVELATEHQHIYKKGINY